MAVKFAAIKFAFCLHHFRISKVWRRTIVIAISTSSKPTEDKQKAIVRSLCSVCFIDPQKLYSRPRRTHYQFTALC